MTNTELVELLRDTRRWVGHNLDCTSVCEECVLAARIDAALAAHDAVPPSEDRPTTAHREGMDRMQQAIIDLLNEHNAPLHLIARIVEMEYP